MTADEPAVEFEPVVPVPVTVDERPVTVLEREFENAHSIEIEVILVLSLCDTLILEYDVIKIPPLLLPRAPILPTLNKAPRKKSPR